MVYTHTQSITHTHIHIISYHIISIHIISYHIISYHIISYHIISYHHIISIHVTTILFRLDIELEVVSSGFFGLSPTPNSRLFCVKWINIRHHPPLALDKPFFCGVFHGFSLLYWMSNPYFHSLMFSKLVAKDFWGATRFFGYCFSVTQVRHEHPWTIPGIPLLWDVHDLHHPIVKGPSS